MSMRRLIWGFLVCFSMAVFVGQTLSQTRGYGRTREGSERSRLRDTDRKQSQQELVQRRLKQQLEGQFKKQIDPAKNEEEPMKQVLKATEKQWKAIKPKLDKVRELTRRANVSIRIFYTGSAIGSGSVSSIDVNKGSGRAFGYGFGGSEWFDGGELVQKQGSTDDSSSRGTSPIHYGWQWLRPSLHRGFENLNEGEKICEELFRLLEGKNSELEQIRQKMEALRKFRQEAKKELAIAQQELRQLVTPRQEATLVMMQLLD